MERQSSINAAGIHLGPSRRGFLGCLGVSPGLTRLVGAGLLGALHGPCALADETPLNAAKRRHRAFVIRRDAAIFQRDAPETPSISNETRMHSQTASRVTARVCRTTIWARWT